MRTTLWVETGASLLLAACLFCCSGGGELHCRPMPAPGGYGYVILHKEDTLIKQPYIPAVGRRQAFPTEQEAMAVGRLVCRKLQEGLPPTVTPEEVEEALKTCR